MGTLTKHIPDRGDKREQLIRYYGYSATYQDGRKEKPAEKTDNLLIYPECKGEMRIKSPLLQATPSQGTCPALIEDRSQV
jgi:hypothetical protein